MEVIPIRVYTQRQNNGAIIIYILVKYSHDIYSFLRVF